MPNVRGNVLAITAVVMARHFLLLVFAALLPSAALAQEEPAQPVQELFFTETVYPQDKGEVQLTFTSHVDGQSERAAIFPATVELGLTDHWQIEASWSGYAASFHSPSDVQTSGYSFGTKYSFMNIGHSQVHAAIGLDVELPNESAFADDVGEDNAEYEPFLALAVDLTRHVTLFGSAGISVEARDLIERERLDDTGTIGAGGLVAFHYVTVALEYTNRSDKLPWRDNGSPLITPAIVVHPGHKWELGFGLPIGTRAGEHKPGFAMNILKEFGGE